MGVESKCIMPLPYYDDDQREHLIRTEYRNLFSVEWWKSLGIDALVLYSWGAPRYRGIARAVRRAGIRMVLHMDTSGDFISCDSSDSSIWHRGLRWLRNKVVDVFRSAHLRLADVITMCPTAAEAVSRYPFYGKWVAERCFPMPCPVSPSCCYRGEYKEKLVLCIGRWDDIKQKRPEMLMETLEIYYAKGGTAESHIIGTVTDALREWHSRLPSAMAEKVRLLGYVRNHQLWEKYCKASVILCTSRYEGSHNVSAEGLCCGCSVVTPNRPSMLRDVHWYTTKESGTIAVDDSPCELANALLQELSLWKNGERDAVQIALSWQPHFHVDKVFNKIFE